MKKGLLIIIPACLLIAGYVVYFFLFAKSDIDKWDFVPEKAALVWENDNGLSAYDSVQQLGIWSAFSELTSIKRLNDYIKSLEDSSEDQSWRTSFSKSPVLVAVCAVSAIDVDALLIVHVAPGASRNALNRSLDYFQDAGFVTKRREYNGTIIEEMRHPSSGAVFSYFLQDDYLVGSFTSFLVEDAVRSVQAKGEENFNTRFPELRTLTPLTQDEGNVYINYDEFSRLLESFTSQKLSLPAHSAFLDVSVNSSSLKVSGFTFPKEGFLSSFSGSPVSFELLDIVPNNTAILKHYSVEGMAQWRTNLMTTDVELSDAAKQLKSTYDIDMQFLFEQIKGEFAIADLEMVGAAVPDRLLFFDLNNVSNASSFLRQSASKMSQDSLFSESIGEFEIFRINDPRFSTALLGARSSLSDECYYLMYRNYVVLSNSLMQLKRVLQSIETDNTWRKSLRVNNMLELANREANFSVFINTPRVWNQFIEALKPEWKPFFLANESGFKSLEYLCLQYSKVDAKFYTSLTAYQPEAPRKPAEVTFGERATLQYAAISKPFVVKSHIDQSLEVLVQDSIYQLYHLNKELDILWTKRLAAPIIGLIQPIDYFSNEKYQYAFVSAGHLHIIDRTGNYLEGFPIKIQTKSPIIYFSVVDYDESKNYRFMCTDADGNIFLLDKTGKPLDGWAPKVGGRGMSMPPRHIRVAGRDAFIVMNRSNVDLVNRSGKSYSGFPVTFNEPLVGAYFPEATGSFETSKLTTLTQNGELLRINFSGRVEYREQLVKAAANTTFGLVPDMLENTYLILRMTDENWEILDAAGVRLFEKTYGRPSPSSVQFYRYGGGKTLLLVSDHKNEILSLFDLQGNGLSARPLQTKNLASVIYFETQGLYQLYLTQGKNVVKVRIN